MPTTVVGVLSRMGTSLVTRPGKKNLLRRVLDAVVMPKGTTLPSGPRRPESPFQSWGYSDVIDAIEDAFNSQTIDVSNSEEANQLVPYGQAYFAAFRAKQNPIITNRLFFRGDHWQNGAGWIGPHPEATADNFVETMQEIYNIFTSKNVIRESVMRHALGVVGRNIQWGFAAIDETVDENGKPTDEVQKKIKEATKLLRPWLQSRKVSTLLRDAICTLLLSERAGIQLTVPSGLADEVDGVLVIQAATIAEALAFIYPEHPLPDNSAVVSDKDTMCEAGIWRYTLDEDDNNTEDDALIEGGSSTAEEEDSTSVEYTALCYVGSDGLTVIKVLGGDDDEDADDVTSTLDLGGRIPMFEMRRAALITMQVQQGQRALNLAESMIPRTAVTSGFMERMLMDAQMPGEPEVDNEGTPTGRWIEKPFYVGAGTTNFIQSTEYLDEEGRTKRANGKVTYREPANASGPITASDKHYRSILDETGQLHVVMAGDSNPSGTSRLNARIEYLSTLQLTQGEVEAAFRFIVDTALAMAEAIANQPGYYTNVIRCQAACRLDAGPLQPAERQAVENSIGKTISQDTAMLLVGIEDVEAEKARMAMDPMARAAFASVIGDALLKLTSPGATLQGAATFIGLTPVQIAALMGGEPGPMQQDPAPAPGTGTPPVEPITGGKDPKKPDAIPAAPVRGAAKGGLQKKALPAPATSTSGSNSGGGLPIAGSK